MVKWMDAQRRGSRFPTAVVPLVSVGRPGRFVEPEAKKFGAKIMGVGTTSSLNTLNGIEKSIHASPFHSHTLTASDSRTQPAVWMHVSAYNDQLPISMHVTKEGHMQFKAHGRDLMRQR